MKKYMFIVLTGLIVSCSDAPTKGKKPFGVKDVGYSDDRNKDGYSGHSDLGDKKDSTATFRDTSADTTPNRDTEIHTGPPVIEQLTMIPQTISVGQSFSFNAQVSDPDGAENIRGGKLEYEQSNFGAFAGGPRNFEKTLSWNEINAKRPITFQRQEVLEFEVTFSDQDGNSSTQLISGTLTCRGEPACNGICGEHACGSSCADFDTDPRHCGRCNNACVGTCTNGNCDAPTGANYGEKCQSDAQCRDSLCDQIDIAGFYTGKVCRKTCVSNASCSAGAACMDLTTIGLDLTSCGNLCQNGICPQGFSCSTLPTYPPGSGNADVCLPVL